VFYYSIALSEGGKVHQCAIVYPHCTDYKLMHRVCFRKSLKLLDLFVFSGKKKSNASDSALMEAPESEGAVGSSAPTGTALQTCGS